MTGKGSANTSSVSDKITELTKKPDRLRGIFKWISMIMVTAAVVCLITASDTDSLKFWIALGILCVVAIAYLGAFFLNDICNKELMAEKSRIAGELADKKSELRRCENEAEAVKKEIAEKAEEITRKDGDLDDLRQKLLKSHSRRDSLAQFPAPALIVELNAEGEAPVISWNNKAFREEIMPEIEEYTNRPLSDVMNIDIYTALNSSPQWTELNGSQYKVTASSGVRKAGGDSESYPKSILLYFNDVTELIQLRHRELMNTDHVAFILVDGFEELFSNVKDSAKTAFTVKIDELVEKFAEDCNCLMKKLSQDRYMAIINEAELERLEGEEFATILDSAHKIEVSDNAVTLSLGIGRGGKDLKESEILAKKALENTQVRGGDQAGVARSEEECTFYGGNFKSVEKNTKVRTRKFSSALMGLIKKSDKVILMGHLSGDFDAVGSACALCSAIRSMGFRAYVYSNFATTRAMPLIERLKNRTGEDIFIDEIAAADSMTADTLLIICDTNSKKQLDSMLIYDNAERIVYIDHHVQVDKDGIDRYIDKLHDPNCSSASELVTEVIQYLPMEHKLSNFYADALLSGIMLDTKNYVIDTKQRTFEASAYLIGLGADATAVKQLFSEPAETGQLRSALVENAGVFREQYVISVAQESSPLMETAAPQAADELMGIRDVIASFVIFPLGKGIKIAARSYGAMNVQMIMEKLGGGGGHQKAAGIYITGETADEVRLRLEAALEEHYRKQHPLTEETDS